jgi:hypothetical protein
LTFRNDVHQVCEDVVRGGREADTSEVSSDEGSVGVRSIEADVSINDRPIGLLRSGLIHQTEAKIFKGEELCV